MDWSSRKIKIAVVCLIALLFALPNAFMMLDWSQEVAGYEGVTVDIVGVRGDFTYDKAGGDYRSNNPTLDEELYVIGDPAPENASRWKISPDRLVIDPDDEFKGVPDLIVKTGQARWMDVDPRDGKPLTYNKEPIEYDINKPDGTVERIHAWIYRTEVDVVAWVHVGEVNPGGSEYPGTEKKSRIQNVEVWFRLGTHQWKRLYGESGRPLFGTVLLVHPEEVEWGACDVWHYGVDDYKPKGEFVNMVISFDPQVGQKTAMYANVEGQRIDPYAPDKDYVPSEDLIKREFVSPDPGNMPDSVYFNVYLEDFGPTPIGMSSEWETPYLIWTFRVDVLVLDKFKVPMPAGLAEPEPPVEVHPYGYWSRVFGWGWAAKWGQDVADAGADMTENLGVDRKWVAWGVYLAIFFCIAVMVIALGYGIWKKKRSA